MSWDTYGQSPNKYVADALEQMRALGADRMEAGYSGGNDEGGVNDIKLFDAAGKEIEAPDFYLEREPRAGDPEYAIREGKVREQHPLWEAADSIMSTKYGTWCGEFEAYGTLFVDVKTGKAWTEGDYQVYTSYDDGAIEVNF